MQPSRPSATYGLPPAPARISGAQGELLIGTYAGAVDKVDLGPLKGEFGRRPLDRFIREKEFTYTAVSGVSEDGERVKVVMAITDLGYASSGFVTVFNIDDKEVLANHSFLGLPGSSDISAEPKEGLQASYNGLFNNARMSLSHPRGARSYSQHIDIPAGGGQPAVAFDATFGAGGPPPVTIIAPMIRSGEDRPGGAEMSVKSQALEGSGILNVGEKSYRLDSVMASIDYSSGFMNHVTEWLWGSVTGRLEDGRAFGINMGEGFNDSDPRANNNLLWVQDNSGEWQIRHLPKLTFEFNPERPLEPWKVSADDPTFQVDLEFEPVAMHAEKRNLGIIAADFSQPSGLWKGQLTDRRTGEMFRFQGADGVAEDQYVKW